MKKIKNILVLFMFTLLILAFSKMQVMQVHAEEGLVCEDILGCTTERGCGGPGLMVGYCELCCDGDGLVEVKCPVKNKV